MVVRSLEKESTIAKSFPVSMSSGTISLTNFGGKAIFLLLINSSKPKVVKPTFWALDTWVFQFWVCNPWPWDFPLIRSSERFVVCNIMKKFEDKNVKKDCIMQKLATDFRPWWKFLFITILPTKNKNGNTVYMKVSYMRHFN